MPGRLGGLAGVVLSEVARRQFGVRLDVPEGDIAAEAQQGRARTGRSTCLAARAGSRRGHGRCI